MYAVWVLVHSCLLRTQCQWHCFSQAAVAQIATMAISDNCAGHQLLGYPVLTTLAHMQS